MTSPIRDAPKTRCVAAEQRNSAILRAIPDMMFVLRRDGTYVDYHARDPSAIYVLQSSFLAERYATSFRLISPRQ